MKVRTLFLVVFAMIFGVSCSGVDDCENAPVEAGREASLQVSFMVNPQPRAASPERLGLGGLPLAYSVQNPGADTEEGTDPGYTPRDVWVIQYGGTADDAPLVGLPRYVELRGPTNIQAVASITANTLVFVANTHNPNIDWGNINTLGHMKTACKVITSEADCYGNNLSATKDLMLSGRYVGVINSGAISAELFRNIARLDFTITNSLGSAMTLHSLQLCSVPRNYCYACGIIARDAIFPLISEYFDYPVEPITGASNPGSTQSFSFYMPANQRGANASSTSSKTKPTYAPAHSSYIRIVATDAQGTAFVYKIYPGVNMVNDYNILANHRYTISLSINSSGDASSDGRVENYGQVNLAPSNCYILNPAPEGTADRIFAIPIERLNDFWLTADPSLTIAQGDEWVVELIWQDTSTPDFIRFIDPDNGTPKTTTTGRGPAQRIALTTKAGYQGNALIGIKKVGRESVGYLWSWHLWVTDYAPEHRSAPVAGQYVYSVAGGAVHRYGGNDWSNALLGLYPGKYMMDRNVGARAAKVGGQGALYYQFGRKDPLPGYEHGNNLYDINGVQLSHADPRNGSTNNQNAIQGVTMATSILNPTVFYFKEAVNDNGDWCLEGKSGTHAWNNPLDGLDKKSLFDPCPVGWKLPMKETWNDFVCDPLSPSTSTALNAQRDPILSWNYQGDYGLRYWPLNQAITDLIYYPSIGHRSLISGVTVSNLNDLYCWTSVALSYKYGHNLYSNSNIVVPQGASDRTYGIPVRCVQQ